MPLDSLNEKVEAYKNKRDIPYKAPLCLAPSLSLNFEQNGNVTACCFNRSYLLGAYPAQSVTEIWEGMPIKKLREVLENNDLSLGCEGCAKMLSEENFESVQIKHFDDYYKYLDKGNWLERLFNFSSTEKKLMPKVFEFELSNTCNLECIMCGGKWSSAIRKNRENLPKLHSPYDDAFVQQIKPYLPTLERCNFLGGEPFLISIYYKIWEEIIKVKPNIEVAMTSNGTILNKRAKEIIQKLSNCKITLSVDSLVPKTWENIRRNGDFEVLRENIEWLKKSGKLVSFSVCPMIQNWEEIPDMIKYCNQNGIYIYFNIVYGPLGERIEGIHEKDIQNKSELIPETSLSRLPKSELKNVIDYYKKCRENGLKNIQFDHLINQLESWHRDKVEVNI